MSGPVRVDIGVVRRALREIALEGAAGFERELRRPVTQFTGDAG